MGILDPYTDAITGLGGLALDAGSFFSQLSTQSYLKGVQRDTWAREDTAVQRRARDLEAAGFNPLLAAGASASTSSPIQVGSPSFGTNGVNAAAGLMRTRRDVAQTEAQTELTAEQLNLVKQQEASVAVDTAKKSAEARNTQLEGDVLERDLEYLKKAKIPSYFAKGIGGQLATGSEVLMDKLNDLGGPLGSAISDYARKGGLLGMAIGGVKNYIQQSKGKK